MVNQSKSLPKYTDIRKFIEQDDAKTLIEAADVIGFKLKQQRLTTSQIRNIFGTVRQIKMNWSDEEKGINSYRQAVLLKPKIGYQARRMERKTKGLLTLERMLEPALDAVIEAPKDERKDRFDRLTDFLEAIVAYHKKHGGSDN